MKGNYIQQTMNIMLSCRVRSGLFAPYTALTLYSFQNRGGATPLQVASKTELCEREEARNLAALRDDGFVESSSRGRYMLSPAGIELVMGLHQDRVRRA